jgi:hypothetical protein
MILLAGQTAEDISLFMLSRFGIVVTEEEVKDTILDGLGGGNSEDDCIDLMEVVATLFIPVLLKAAKVEVHGETLSDKYERPDPNILQKTLTMILEDVSRPTCLRILRRTCCDCCRTDIYIIILLEIFGLAERDRFRVMQRPSRSTKSCSEKYLPPTERRI